MIARHAIAVPLWLALVSTVPAQVRVVTALPEAAVPLLEARLEAAGVAAEIERRPTSVLWAQAQAGDVAADLLAGVDAEVVEQATVPWVPAPLPDGSAVQPFWIGASDRYLVPWAVPWVAVWRAGRVAPARVPRRIGQWIEFEGRIVLAAPQAAPSLFGAVFLDRFRSLNRDHVFGWLRALDAAAAGYAETPEAVLSDLDGAVPAVAFALRFDVERARGAGADLLWSADVAPFPVVQGLAVALATEGPEVLEARDALLDATLALRLATEFGIVPGLRDPDDLPARILAELPAVRHWRPTPGPLARWIAEWEVEVRGKGGLTERLDRWLGFAFAFVFVAVLWFVHREMKRERSA